MANYNLVLDTKFKPFSYSEMLAPVLAATQAHQALEEEYGDLAQKASVFDGLANEQTDPYAYKMYKTFANDLEARAEQLMKYGLTPSSRKGMLDMRTRYSKEIIPIELAYKRREELAKEQRDASKVNPTLFYQRQAAQMSLDDFIKNPSLDYGASYSGELLAQQAGEMAESLKQVLTGRSKLKGIGLPFQYEQLLQYGFTPEDIRLAINDPTNPKAAPILNTIVEQVLDASGIRKWASREQMARARAFANRGLYKAIGTTSIKNFTDTFGEKNALDAISHARSVAAARAAQREKERRDNRLNPLPLRSQEEIDNANAKINQYLRAGYYKEGPNGHLIMTEKGKQAYYKKEDVYDTKMTGSGRYAHPVTYKTGEKKNSAFRTFVDSIGGAKYAGPDAKGNPSVQPGNMGILFQKYIDSNKSTSYDTYHTTEYDRQLNSTYGESYLKQIKSAASSNNKLDIVTFKNRQWKKTGSISTDDLKDYTVTNVRYSKHGNTAILQKKDGSGNPVRIMLPAGIHIGAESNVATAIRNADDWGLILDTGRRPRLTVDKHGQPSVQKDRKGNILYTADPLTDEDRAVFNDLYDEALSDIGSYGSQIVVPSQTKEEEYELFNF